MPAVSTKIRLVDDRVAVKLDDPIDKTDGGIVLPDRAQSDSTSGTVIATGEGKISNGTRILMTVQVGDRVVIGQYGSSKIEVDGEEVTIIHEADVLAILD